MADVFLSCLDPNQDGDLPALKKTKSTIDEEGKQAEDPKKISERLTTINQIVSDKIEIQLLKKGS